MVRLREPGNGHPVSFDKGSHLPFEQGAVVGHVVAGLRVTQNFDYRDKERVRQGISDKHSSCHGWHAYYAVPVDELGNRSSGFTHIACTLPLASRM